MAGARKRKHDAGESEITAAQTKRQKGMQDFGNVGKPQRMQSAKAVKGIAVQERPHTPPPQPAKPRRPQKEGKRKRQVESDSDADETEGDTAAQDANPFKRFAKKTNAQSKRVRQDLPPSQNETPRSKVATDLFDRLKLDQKAIPFSLQFGKPDTPPDTPEAETQTALPAELQDLVRLYAAFLTSLSLHSAHNREMTGMQVSSLLPMMTKNWRKRKVTVDDLQMLLGIDGAAQEFALEDYGRAGIRLAITKTPRSTHRIGSPVNDEALKAGFETALQSRWDEHNLAAGASEPSIPTFLASLPRLPTRQDTSTTQTAPLFERGKQRLAALKSDRAATLLSSSQTSVPIQLPNSQKTATAITNRGTSLLDRILAKQSHTSSLPTGPTRAQLDRQAALHRVEDVTRVLGLLAGTKTRISYSMPSIVQQLQQSLRNPISREEVERCLGVMAEEISPEFVRVVEMGGVKGVVISTIGRVGLEELRGRVRDALARSCGV